MFTFMALAVHFALTFFPLKCYDDIEFCVAESKEAEVRENLS